MTTGSKGDRRSIEARGTREMNLAISIMTHPSFVRFPFKRYNALPNLVQGTQQRSTEHCHIHSCSPCWTAGFNNRSLLVSKWGCICLSICSIKILHKPFVSFFFMPALCPRAAWRHAFIAPGSGGQMVQDLTSSAMQVLRLLLAVRADQRLDQHWSKTGLDERLDTPWVKTQTD